MVRSLPPIKNGKLRCRDRTEHKNLFKVRRQFEQVSGRIDRPRRLRSAAMSLALGCMVGAVIGGAYAAFDRLSPWSLVTLGRHLAAAPNCSAAQWVGLAPAERGDPGYYQRHDRDQDGIACEPFTYR